MSRADFTKWLWPIVLSLAVVASPREAAESVRVDSAPLLDDLRVLSADNMEGRQTGTAGAEKARAFVIKRFRDSGILPFGSGYEAPFTYRAGRPATERQGINIVGHIDGKRQPQRYIVISAHYDHLGVRNGTVFNGADDNASGTAALFTIARYFATHRSENSLIFAAFDAEEGGLFGSRAFVKQPPVEARFLILDLNADMIGREPNDRLFVVGIARQPFLKPYIDAVASQSPVKLLIGHEDPRRPEDWTRDSDHYSFMQAKIPALYFGVEDFDQHHQPTDDYETITYDFYVRAVETLVQVVRQFDGDLDPVEKNRLAR